MGLALLLAPLLLLRNPTAPQGGTVLATAGPTDAPFVVRTFASRAGRSSAVARVAIAAATTTTTTLAAPPTTTPPARRHLAAATTTAPRLAPTTSTRPRPAPATTTSTRPPAPAPTSAPAPAPTPAHSQTGEASWYRGPDGECAHNTAPLGSIIRVTNLDNGRSTTCRVAGRGPYGGGRVVDLTQSTFARVASVDAGVFRARVDW
jgi:rare lipoprotein A (peptidoglycan hydrolase)